MGTALWTAFAVTAMLAIFAACVAVVVAGIRVLENVRERRRRKEAG